MYDRDATAEFAEAPRRGSAELALDLFPIAMAAILMLTVWLRVG
jgi:hypothetical protein